MATFMRRSVVAGLAPASGGRQMLLAIPALACVRPSVEPTFLSSTGSGLGRSPGFISGTTSSTRSGGGCMPILARPSAGRLVRFHRRHRLVDAARRRMLTGLPGTAIRRSTRRSCAGVVWATAATENGQQRGSAQMLS